MKVLFVESVAVVLQHQKALNKVFARPLGPHFLRVFFTKNLCSQAHHSSGDTADHFTDKIHAATPTLGQERALYDGRLGRFGSNGSRVGGAVDCRLLKRVDSVVVLYIGLGILSRLLGKS